MATTTHVPVEVYLRSSYEPDAEYVDGEIEERPAGTARSRILARGDSRVVFGNMKKNGTLRSLPSLRVKVALPVIVFPISPCLIAVSRENRSSPTLRLLSLKFCLLKTLCSG